MAAKKKVEQVLTSWEEADAALNEIGQCNARISAANSEATHEINRIQTDLREATIEDAERGQLLMLALEQFVGKRQDELSGRSLKLTSGTVGYRLTPPALKCQKGVKWDQVVNICQALNRNDLLNYTTPKPDKEAIKKLADDEPKIFKKLPVEIVQNDEFFAEPTTVAANHPDTK